MIKLDISKEYEHIIALAFIVGIIVWLFMKR